MDIIGQQENSSILHQVFILFLQEENTTLNNNCRKASLKGWGGGGRFIVGIAQGVTF